MRNRLFVFALVVLVGCNGKQPEFPEVHPVKGVVKRDGQAVKGGAILFTPDPEKPNFLINSEVGDDGTFTLSTVRTTDRRGERKTGAPSGKYKVTYMPAGGDQTAKGETGPIELPTPVTVNAGENNIPINLPKK